MEFYDLPASTQKAIKDTILDHYPEELPKTTKIGAMVEDGNTTTLEICGINNVFGHVTLEKNREKYTFQGYKKQELGEK